MEQNAAQRGEGFPPIVKADASFRKQTRRVRMALETALLPPPLFLGGGEKGKGGLGFEEFPHF